MPRLREMLVVGTACAVCLLAYSNIVSAQEAPAPGTPPPKSAPIAEPSPLLTEPASPEESFRAVLLMVDLARLDLAVKYLEQFNSSTPDDAMLIKMRDKHGTAAFVKIARIKELSPIASPLLEQLNKASRKQSDDPAYIESLITRLSKDPTERENATVELRNAGPRAVPQIIRQMSRPEMETQQDLIVMALIRMGRQVVPPLLGAMDSPQERIRAAIIGILATLEAKEAIPHLWFPAFSETQPLGIRIAANRALAKLVTGSADRIDRLSSVAASNELRRLARMLFENANLLPAEEDGTVTIWGWDAKEATVTPKTYSPAIASMLMSTRFASQSLSLSPEQGEPQRQYLASLLGLEILQQGWDKPHESLPGTAMYLAVTAGEETVASVLSDALIAEQPATAIGAIEVLSQIGTREQLLNQKGLKSPLVAALNSPDVRIQFAAAVAILRIEPRFGFANSSRVVSVLSRALTDPGRGRAIIIDPDQSRGTQTGSYLNDMGYDIVMASTGREGFERASENAGIEVVFVHANVARWELTQTISNLRADSRTAALPIVVYGSEDFRASVSRLIARSKPALYIAESSTVSDFQRQFAPFSRSSKSPPLSDQERQQQKAAAAYWLASLNSGRGGQVFDVAAAEKQLSLVADDPSVAENVLAALSGISTASAQRRLATVAINSQLEPAHRQVAASQLSFHIQRFGLLLTKDEVAAVNDSWVASDHPAVKSALAGVMGTLRPNATLVGERLRQFAVPVAKPTN